MKPTKLILSGLACALLLSGCAANDGTGEDTNGGQAQETTSNTQAYREVILQLQKELETLRATQAQQTTDYENKINELETLIAELEGSQSSADGESSKNTSVPAESLYAYTVSEEGATVTSYLGTDTLAEIPATLDGKPVIAIGEGAFRNSGVEQVIIPAGVKTIDWFAFYGSYRLRSVILPASVTAIEYGAFELCASSIKFTCPSDSYAARYAKSYGIPVIPA